MTIYRDPFTLEEAMREIRHSRKTNESMRQRVKELEAENQLAWNTCEKAETREAKLSLAALKAGQGEPVATAHVGNRTFYVTGIPAQLGALGFHSDIREHLLTKLLRETLPYLQKVEDSPSTSAVLRALIADINHVTTSKGN